MNKIYLVLYYPRPRDVVSLHVRARILVHPRVLHDPRFRIFPSHSPSSASRTLPSFQGSRLEFVFKGMIVISYTDICRQEPREHSLHSCAATLGLLSSLRLGQW